MENKRYIELIGSKVNKIYEVTQGQGYMESWKKFNDRTMDELVAEMTRRGILIKVPYLSDSGRGMKWNTKWVASMKPTKTLIESLASTIRRNRYERNKRYLEKKAKLDALNSVEPQTLPSSLNQPVTTKVVDEKPVEVSSSKQKFISSLSPQELWNELKSRGYEIEDGKLVRITREFLD